MRAITIVLLLALIAVEVAQLNRQDVVLRRLEGRIHTVQGDEMTITTHPVSQDGITADITTTQGEYDPNETIAEHVARHRLAHNAWVNSGGTP